MSAPVPTVYLPGAGGLASFWRPVAQCRRGGRESVFFGYPGFGDAPQEPSIGSLPDLATWLSARSPETFDLVAQSMGGLLALWIALLHPARVRRMALVATSGGVDVAALGARPWRPAASGWMAPNAPRWFVDDDSDLTPQLGAVRAPTLLIFGDEDPLAPPAIGTFLRQRIPDSRLVVVAGGTHALGEEQPELLAGLLDDHFPA